MAIVTVISSDLVLVGRLILNVIWMISR